jgi:hypothetical protein
MSVRRALSLGAFSIRFGWIRMNSVILIICVCLLTVSVFVKVATWTPERGALSPREMLGGCSDLFDRTIGT